MTNFSFSFLLPVISLRNFFLRMPKGSWDYPFCFLSFFETNMTIILAIAVPPINVFIKLNITNKYIIVKVTGKHLLYKHNLANNNVLVLFWLLWWGDIWRKNQISIKLVVSCAFFAYISLKCGIWKAMEHAFDIFHEENPHFFYNFEILWRGDKI